MAKTEPWLLLMHQIPPKPDSLRVRVWRTLQKIGALQLKNSVYILPASPANQNTFQQVLEEIVAGKGDAFICRSEFVHGIEHKDLVSNFNDDRSARYRHLAGELREVQKILAAKKLTENDLMDVEHSIGKLERQLNELKEIDFFACADQKPTANLLKSMLTKLDHLRGSSGHKIAKRELKEFQGKTWVTRKGIHVDRLASAWLIAKFIDRKCKFRFVADNNYAPKKNEFRFDMFEGEFTHIGDNCTFEVLADSFSLTGNAIRAIAEIIHDLDLKDTKFNRPETSGIGLVIKGIVNSEKTDEGRLKKGFDLFDDLEQSLK